MNREDFLKEAAIPKEVSDLLDRVNDKINTHPLMHFMDLRTGNVLAMIDNTVGTTLAVSVAWSKICNDTGMLMLDIVCFNEHMGKEIAAFDEWMFNGKHVKYHHYFDGWFYFDILKEKKDEQ